ncbi:DUF3043 domain-containing protein [Galbitalea soli]|uniref:DUF3043 domain-containing protein n=1 Tax=Galbitalea soli TaxID=1268042 RepID=A0A7C9PLE5_9MICO|nr:DUF3043 domain-containing protein [Galbitalea soli]NYJ30734.1 hypothetical protein [Galbitalea soli]
MAKTPASNTDDAIADELGKNPVAPKGRATPSRKEREAARKRPLVAGRDAASRKAARSAEQAARERARIGMTNGEERYLPAKDRGPQKRYVRDYVDARFSIGELMIPVVGLLFIASLVTITSMTVIIEIAIYSFFALVAIDVVVLGFILNRRLAEKFGAANVERIRLYAAMRAIQFRRLRLPKPQVKRGAYPR